MPKSKTRKNHKKKVEARNVEMKNDTTRVQKAQREFINNLIKQEQEKGMFDGTPSIDGPIVGPTI